MPLFGTRGAASVTGFGGLAKLGYLLRNSLRFRGANSAYLSRTPSVTGNRKVWTWSGWVKRGQLDSGATDRVLFSSPNQSGNDGVSAIYFNADKLHTYYDTSGANPYGPVGPALYRDPAAWYHIVWAVDAANTIHYVYVNNVLVSTDTGKYPPNYEYAMNRSGGYTHTMGTQAWGPTNYFDGYMTEINFVDGQALTPSSFGKTDPATGQWIPIKYSGTYGTNGFYLKFTDASAATAAAIGKDSSGNGNNWTPNNISVTAGATYDSMTDVPTLTSATAANYAVINPLDYNSTYLTLSAANLQQTYAGVSAAAASRATMAIPTTGKFYWEITLTTIGTNNTTIRAGICNPTTAISGNSIDNASTAYLQITSGHKRNNNSDSTYGAAFSNGQILQVLYDATAGAIYFGQNNLFANGSGSFNQVFASATAAFTSLSGEFMPCFITYGGSDIAVNFGQRPFAYTPPSGYVALNSFNLA